MAGTLIPRNSVRKTSRALIDSAWQAGNRRPGEAATAQVDDGLVPVALPERRAQITRKIEEIAARRVRVRGLRF